MTVFEMKPIALRFRPLAPGADAGVGAAAPMLALSISSPLLGSGHPCRENLRLRV
jgi:hypothetical protein